MKKGFFSVGTAALLSLGLFTSQALAQDFCSSGAHSGTSTKTNGTQRDDEYQTISKIGDYDYELWYRGGNGASSATFYSDGSMKCSAVNSHDYLCRSGLSFECDNQQKKCFKTYDQLGHLYADFKVSLSGQQNIGYSFIGIYGWSRDPVIEYYIVDTWASQYKPGGTSWGWSKKGDYYVDGVKYEAWTHTQVEQWSVDGVMTFEQYYGVRDETKARNCGTIDITKHFDEWAKLGMKLGKMYEAKVLGEVGNTNGTASCEFDFPVSRVYTGTASTPTSSASTNPTSSASATSQVAYSSNSVPGTIEFENFDKGGDGVAYSVGGYDSDYTSTGYRDEQVEVIGTSTGHGLGYITPGDWMEYSINVTYTGTYDFEISAGTGADNASSIELSIDGQSVGTAEVPVTDWSTFSKVTGTTTSISAGPHVLRVTFTSGYVNADYIKFTEKDVDKGNPYVPPTALAKVRMVATGKDLQVFDMQGRDLGRVSVAAGASIQDALFAKFHRAGVYLVKQGNQMTRVRVTR